MLKELKARTPAESKPVCAWSLPASQILEKTESDLSGGQARSSLGSVARVQCVGASPFSAVPTPPQITLTCAPRVTEA